jgi:riboflavin synthase
LTVDAIDADGFEADASAETLARTTLGALAVGDEVNLERALRAGDRMGGHVVTGHVDGFAAVVEVRHVGEATVVAFALSRELGRFVAEKGSITVSGVSLTVNAVSGADDEARFEVALIPHTLQKTTLAALAPGTRVNVEVDLLARYVVRALETSSASGGDAVWMERLRRAGYV